MRELEHAVERAVIVARTNSVRVRELPPEIWQNSPAKPAGGTLDLQANDRQTIERALRRFRGSRRDAAKTSARSPCGGR